MQETGSRRRGILARAIAETTITFFAQDQYASLYLDTDRSPHKLHKLLAQLMDRIIFVSRVASSFWARFIIITFDVTNPHKSVWPRFTSVRYADVTPKLDKRISLSK